MTVLTIVYIVIGCGAAASLLMERRSHGALAGPMGALLMVGFWPFLFPVAFFADTSSIHGATTRGVRLNRLRDALLEAWSEDDRARAVVRRYVERLETAEQRRQELHAGITGAPERIRIQLTQLHQRFEAQVDEGLELLEELHAQLTLHKFTKATAFEQDDETEKSGVEDLLSRMAVLTQL